MNDEEKLLTFPCSYPLKVMGENTSEFYSTVCAIVEKHVGTTSEIAYSVRTSSGEKYMSITATFSAESEEQLTALYKELNEHRLVRVTI
jgi:putative lipoic acid-binding regulatory protein